MHWRCGHMDAILLYICRIQMISMMPADGPGMSSQLTTALFEALYHPALLHDEDIMLKLGHVMVHLSISYEIDFTEHRQRAAGLYSLLTHPDVAVRSLVNTPSFESVVCVGDLAGAVTLLPCLIEL